MRQAGCGSWRAANKKILNAFQCRLIVVFSSDRAEFHHYDSLSQLQESLFRVDNAIDHPTRLA
jgi:hypothetical protein